MIVKFHWQRVDTLNGIDLIQGSLCRYLVNSILPQGQERTKFPYVRGH